MYQAKARAEQAADHVSDCERKVWRLKEELSETAKKARKLAGSTHTRRSGVLNPAAVGDT